MGSKRLKYQNIKQTSGSRPNKKDNTHTKAQRAAFLLPPSRFIKMLSTSFSLLVNSPPPFFPPVFVNLAKSFVR